MGESACWCLAKKLLLFSLIAVILSTLVVTAAVTTI